MDFNHRAKCISTRRHYLTYQYKKLKRGGIVSNKISALIGGNNIIYQFFYEETALDHILPFL